MSGGTGLMRRLTELASPAGFFHFLALDHGLSLGWMEGQDPPSKIVANAHRAGVTRVVAHRGLVADLSRLATAGTILQLCAGSPLHPDKALVARPAEAVQLACLAVALEFKTTSQPEYLARASAAVVEAHEFCLPVLIMASYADRPGYEGAAAALLGAHQLGADLIKLPLPYVYGSEDTDAPDWFCQLIAEMPPLLLAGGEFDRDLQQHLLDARAMGFRGTCIGRNYFTAAMAGGVAVARDVAFPERAA